jgi:6-pyruvoyltetrahydropterin/6-carboxytetrahydropterin synthase
MYLTISKRFEFCASHRCTVPGWTEEQNLACFGRESKGKYGHGHNYIAFFVFHGQVDKKTGMLADLSALKQEINSLLQDRYDHKYLNLDTQPFDKLVPTVENLAAQLLTDTTALFSKQAARPVVCHLMESPESSATAYSGGKVERHASIDFSAARRTYSPHLSDEENVRFFGQAASPSGHGHNYNLRVNLTGEIDRQTGLIISSQKLADVISRLHSQLDHRNLNQDVPGLKGLPITTEILARFVWQQLEKDLPLQRVRLQENTDFFIEYSGENRFQISLAKSFNAAHRLHSLLLSEQENQKLYGKCNNPQGHGHQYKVECTIQRELDEHSGTLMHLGELDRRLETVLAEWDYKHLDLESEDFRQMPSTGENIVQVLWEKLDSVLDNSLFRLRLWETPNNRFTIRKKL